mgnify:CR=1 FL=1
MPNRGNDELAATMGHGSQRGLYMLIARLKYIII